MTLLLIILAFTSLSIVIRFYPKSYNIIMLFTIFCVISSYFMFTKNFTSRSFFPTEYQSENDCPYNRLTSAIRNKQLYIYDKLPPIFDDPNIYKNFIFYSQQDNTLMQFYDFSYYKGKIYFYWGITPVLLFYLPFNLITNLCLSDNFIVFFSISLIFLLSLIILKKIINIIFIETPFKTNVLFYLSTLLIGFGNYSLFLAVRPYICEVAISLAALLLLLSIYLFIELINEKQKHTNLITFFIGFCLSLSVGCRPHYVLFIPIFYILIIYIYYKRTKNIKDILIKSSFFIIPCIIYGSVLALYNYLRFDSIFEFGWKYQFNHVFQYYFVPTIKDFLLGFKYHLLQFPEIDKESYTLFSSFKNTCHRVGNEGAVSLFYLYPLSILIFLLPILSYIKQNKKVLSINILLFSFFIINLIIACFLGAIQRYVFEYLYILVILTLIIFLRLSIT